jgi:hypothetical protein
MELDPRYLIAKETDFVDHDIDISKGWHAVSLELAGSSQLRELQRYLGGEGRIHKAHLDADALLTVATAEVSYEGLLKLEKLANKQGTILRRFEYAQVLKPPRIRPIPGLALPGGIEVAPQSTSAKPGVVFAVIDYGCPFMHPLLCAQSGTTRSTRVRALWDQQPAASNNTRTTPKGFEYGTELSSEQLNAVIRAAAGDERLAYESLGYQALRMRESHGAHSLGMLLDDGLRPRGSARNGDERPDVLFVQLPQGLLSAPNRAVLSRYVVDALVWIESHREPDERVILSLSHGSSQGPNDGSSIVERALQAFTQWGPRGADNRETGSLDLNRIYIAAGNGFEERLHSQARLSPSVPASFLLRVPPASELPASVEIWLPTGENGSMAAVQVEVFAPDGRLAAQVMPGQIVHWPNAQAAAASVASTSWRGNGCTLCLIRLAPTAASGTRACAPVGDWTIKLTANTGLEEPVHLYIGRVKQALGFPLRTVQSTFVPSGRHGFVDASGEGTLQGLATSEGVIRVGGVIGVRDKPAPASYSSRGPSRDGSIAGPDISVRVDDGAVLRGRRSIGNRSGVSFRMNGTSVGAPLAARLDRDTPRPPPDRPGGKREERRMEQPGDAGAKGTILLDPFDD